MRLTHEVLTTFIAEVSAIVNGRPIVPVSTDPESPQILSQSTLLTQKTDSIKQPYQEYGSLKDLYRSQWKCIQALADQFWGAWKKEYLQTLQKRRKWTTEKPNIQEQDIVLLKDSLVARNDWPVGIVDRVMPSSDGKVRKVIVRINRDGTTSSYTRPISELVVLLSVKEQ